MSALLGAALSFLAAIAKAGKSVTTKSATVATDEYVTGAAVRLVGVPIFGALLLLTGEFALSMSAVFWVAFAANTILLTALTYYINRAFKLSDVSIIAPLLALMPIMMIPPAVVLLGEVPSPLAFVGIVLVTVGAYALNLQEREHGYLEPIRVLTRDAGARAAGISILLAAFVPSVDKLGIRETSPLTWTFLTHLSIGLAFLVLIHYKSESWREELEQHIWVLVLVGLFNAGLWVGQSYAYLYTQAVYVQALKRSSILLVVLAGWLWFDEPHVRNRLLGATAIFIGVVAVVLGA